VRESLPMRRAHALFGVTYSQRRAVTPRCALHERAHRLSKRAAGHPNRTESLCTTRHTMLGAVHCTSGSGSAGFSSLPMRSPHQRFEHGSVRSTTHRGARSLRLQLRWPSPSTDMPPNRKCRIAAPDHRERGVRSTGPRVADRSYLVEADRSAAELVGATAPPPRLTTPLSAHENAWCRAISSKVRVPDVPCHPSQRAVRGIAPVYSSGPATKCLRESGQVSKAETEGDGTQLEFWIRQRRLDQFPEDRFPNGSESRTFGFRPALHASRAHPQAPRHDGTFRTHTRSQECAGGLATRSWSDATGVTSVASAVAIFVN